MILSPVLAINSIPAFIGICTGFALFFLGLLVWGLRRGLTDVPRNLRYLRAPLSSNALPSETLWLRLTVCRVGVESYIMMGAVFSFSIGSSWDDGSLKESLRAVFLALPTAYAPIVHGAVLLALSAYVLFRVLRHKRDLIYGNEAYGVSHPKGFVAEIHCSPILTSLVGVLSIWAARDNFYFLRQCTVISTVESGLGGTCWSGMHLLSFFVAILVIMLFSVLAVCTSDRSSYPLPHVPIYESRGAVTTTMGLLLMCLAGYLSSATSQAALPFGVYTLGALIAYTIHFIDQPFPTEYPWLGHGRAAQLSGLCGCGVAGLTLSQGMDNPSSGIVAGAIFGGCLLFAVLGWLWGQLRLPLFIIEHPDFVNDFIMSPRRKFRLYAVQRWNTTQARQVKRRQALAQANADHFDDVAGQGGEDEVALAVPQLSFLDRPTEGGAEAAFADAAENIVETFIAQFLIDLMTAPGSSPLGPADMIRESLVAIGISSARLGGNSVTQRLAPQLNVALMEALASSSEDKVEQQMDLFATAGVIGSTEEGFECLMQARFVARTISHLSDIVSHRSPICVDPIIVAISKWMGSQRGANALKSLDVPLLLDTVHSNGKLSADGQTVLGYCMRGMSSGRRNKDGSGNRDRRSSTSGRSREQKDTRSKRELIDSLLVQVRKVPSHPRMEDLEALFPIGDDLEAMMKLGQDDINLSAVHVMLMELEHRVATILDSCDAKYIYDVEDHFADLEVFALEFEDRVWRVASRAQWLSDQDERVLDTLVTIVDRQEEFDRKHPTMSPKLFENKLFNKIEEGIHSWFDFCLDDCIKIVEYLHACLDKLLPSLIKIEKQVVEHFPKEWDMFFIYWRVYHERFEMIGENICSRDSIESQDVFMAIQFAEAYEDFLYGLGEDPFTHGERLVDTGVLQDAFIPQAVDKMQTWARNIMAQQDDIEVTMTPDGLYFTLNHVDLFRMLNEQLFAVARAKDHKLLLKELLLPDIITACIDILYQYEEASMQYAQENWNDFPFERLCANVNNHSYCAEYTSEMATKVEGWLGSADIPEIAKLEELRGKFTHNGKLCTSILLDAIMRDLKDPTKALLTEDWLDQAVTATITDTLNDYFRDCDNCLAVFFFKRLVMEALDRVVFLYVEALLTKQQLTFDHSVASRLEVDLELIEQCFMSWMAKGMVKKQMQVLNLLSAVITCHIDDVLDVFDELQEVHPDADAEVLESILLQRPDVSDDEIDALLDQVPEAKYGDSGEGLFELITEHHHGDYARGQNWKSVMGEFVKETLFLKYILPEDDPVSTYKRSKR